MLVLSWLMSSITNNLIGGIVYDTSAHIILEDLRKKFHKIDGARTFNLHHEITSLT